MDPAALAADIKSWGKELGFQQVGITDVDLGRYAPEVRRWIEDGFHGSMGYMASELEMRLCPPSLLPGTARVIAARMDYLPEDTGPAGVLGDPTLGYVSRYALGRDYHKLVRARLTTLVERIRAVAAPLQCRAFTDSAPILEKALAEKAGLGWIGKNTLLLNRDAGSFFFLGEIFTDLPLPLDEPQRTEHCGACRACINVCPTGAIVDAKHLDARRCISYLTIEHRGAIPVELRRPIGNRIFGCDDCQLICPWNRFAKPSCERDFVPRAGLDRSPLLELFGWDEATFLARTEGSALRRINYRQWQRNLAVALGNAPYDPAIVDALERRRAAIDPVGDALVAEHIDWAIEQQELKSQRSSARG
jgi:epoxyqueuosine reductase